MIDQSVGHNPALFEKDVGTTLGKTFTSMPEARNESERYIVAQLSMRKEHSHMTGDDRLASYLETEIRKCGSNGLPSPTEASYTEGIEAEMMDCADQVAPGFFEPESPVYKHKFDHIQSRRIRGKGYHTLFTHSGPGLLALIRSTDQTGRNRIGLSENKRSKE
ncbi:hypothetical protein BDV25DRAFT_133854 [Aspergillus avenaceus]|uniref:Uncharacterized protein n=1 Tax=Aspergillus avenaceus TaxID=36643 RepID=A0A5N6TG50_ASPAV|nr:hypothetical protein BDV25DRAFT_133854 [Aspergillus avenaceus]